MGSIVESADSSQQTETKQMPNKAAADGLRFARRCAPSTLVTIRFPYAVVDAGWILTAFVELPVTGGRLYD